MFQKSNKLEGPQQVALILLKSVFFQQISLKRVISPSRDIISILAYSTVAEFIILWQYQAISSSLGRLAWKRLKPECTEMLFCSKLPKRFTMYSQLGFNAVLCLIISFLQNSTSSFQTPKKFTITGQSNQTISLAAPSTIFNFKLLSRLPLDITFRYRQGLKLVSWLFSIHLPTLKEQFSWAQTQQKRSPDFIFLYRLRRTFKFQSYFQESSTKTCRKQCSVEVMSLKFQFSLSPLWGSQQTLRKLSFQLVCIIQSIQYYLWNPMVDKQVGRTQQQRETDPKQPSLLAIQTTIASLRADKEQQGDALSNQILRQILQNLSFKINSFQCTFLQGLTLTAFLLLLH